MRQGISWFVVLLLTLATHLHAQQTDEGFTPLFNGKDLTGWDGDSKFWSVQEGMIVGQTTKDNPAPHNTFLIYKGEGAKPKKFADFELRASFHLINHNSGIQYRSKELPEHVMSGYQADMAEGNPSPYTGMLYEEKGRGIIAKRGQKVTIDKDGKKTVETFGDDTDMGKQIDMKDWHAYVIIAKGDHLTQYIDGKKTIEVIDDQKGKAAKTGYIGLQIHMGQPMKVEFKNIRIKELKGE